jgi:hypothetical protein
MASFGEGDIFAAPPHPILSEDLDRVELGESRAIEGVGCRLITNSEK